MIGMTMLITMLSRKYILPIAGGMLIAALVLFSESARADLTPVPQLPSQAGYVDVFVKSNFDNCPIALSGYNASLNCPKVGPNQSHLWGGSFDSTGKFIGVCKTKTQAGQSSNNPNGANLNATVDCYQRSNPANITYCGNSNFTTCDNWQQCSIAQGDSGQKQKRKCYLPSSSTCTPTADQTHGSQVYIEQEELCCSASDYDIAFGVCSDESTASEVSSAPSQPTKRETYTKKSGKTCVDTAYVPQTANCCRHDVNMVGSYGNCTRDGDSGKKSRSKTPYTCSGSTLAAGSQATERISCTDAPCGSSDYNAWSSWGSAENQSDSTTNISGGKTRVVRVASQKRTRSVKSGTTCVAPQSSLEETQSCYVSKPWECDAIGQCAAGVNPPPVTQTCTEKPDLSSISGAVSCATSLSSISNPAQTIQCNSTCSEDTWTCECTPDNEVPLTCTKTTECSGVDTPNPADSSDEVAKCVNKSGILPPGDAGQTLRHTGLTWKGDLFLKNYTNSSTRRIGIGTIAAAPTERLEVSGSGDSQLGTILISEIDTSQNPTLKFRYADSVTSGSNTYSKHWSLFVDKANANSFTIWGASEEPDKGSARLTILSNGNVGIGVSDPGLPLQIDHASAPFMGFRTAGGGTPANSVRFSVGARDDTNARRAEIEVQSKHDLAFFTSSTLRAAISSDGSFTIGTSTQFADSAQLLVHKAAIPGTGFITGEGSTTLTDTSRAIIVPSINGGPTPVPPPGSESGRSPDATPPPYTPPAPVSGDGGVAPAPTPPPQPAPTPASAGGTPVVTPASPAPVVPAPTPAPAPTPIPSRGIRSPGTPGSSGGARAPETTFLASLTGFFSNLWSTIAGNPIQSSYAVNIPMSPFSGSSSGGAMPTGAHGPSLDFAKKLTGSGTLFKTELDVGDYIYIPSKQALYIIESEIDETNVNVIQVAGIIDTATMAMAVPKFFSINPASGTQQLPFRVLKKGNVFRVERDLGIRRPMDGSPIMAQDLVVDNRGIVNIGGEIAPPGMSDLSLFVTGKVKADGYCIGVSGTCISTWGDLNFWSKTSDGTGIYPTNLTQKMGIGTATPKSLLQIGDTFGINGSGLGYNIYGDGPFSMKRLSEGEVSWVSLLGGSMSLMTFPTGAVDSSVSGANTSLTLGKGVVSVGTTNVTDSDRVSNSLLEVKSDTLARLSMVVPGVGSTVKFFADARHDGVNKTQQGEIGTASPHDLVFFTNDINHLTLTNGGDLYSNKSFIVGKGLKGSDNAPMSINHPSFARSWFVAAKAAGDGSADANSDNDVKMLVGAINTDTSNAGQLGVITNHDLKFYTNNRERFLITKEGNLGIGTSTPQALLELDKWGQGQFKIFNTEGNGHDLGWNGGEDSKFWISNFGAESGETRFVWQNGTTNRTLMTLKNTGVVNIPGEATIGKIGGDVQLLGTLWNKTYYWNLDSGKLDTKEICLSGTCKTTWPQGIDNGVRAGDFYVKEGTFRTTKNQQTMPIPDSDGGLAVAWNQTGGQAEVDLYNMYITPDKQNGATTSFRFTQMTKYDSAANTVFSRDLLLLKGDGAVEVPGALSVRGDARVRGNLQVDGNVDAKKMKPIVNGDENGNPVWNRINELSIEYSNGSEDNYAISDWRETVPNVPILGIRMGGNGDDGSACFIFAGPYFAAYNGKEMWSSEQISYNLNPNDTSFSGVKLDWQFPGNHKETAFVFRDLFKGRHDEDIGKAIDSGVAYRRGYKRVSGLEYIPAGTTISTIGVRRNGKGNGYVNCYYDVLWAK